MNAISKKPREIVQDMMDTRDDISENKLQNDVVKWLMPLEVKCGFRVVHIPNGGHRRKREGRQLKNRGLRAGFPDLMILRVAEMIDWDERPTDYGQAIFIELKTPKGKPDPEQVAWHTILENMMFPIHVCTSLASVLTVLRSHGLKV